MVTERTLAWRNLVVSWHQDNPDTGCGCDDQTSNSALCSESTMWADQRVPDESRPVFPEPDPWQHDLWVAAWKRNAPVIVSDLDYRIPSPPTEMSWLLTRHLVRGEKVIELRLLRPDSDYELVTRRRSEADPDSVISCAREMVEESR